MCIAIVAPSGTRIPDAALYSSYKANQDGAGIAYIKDGKVEITKGIFNVLDLLTEYEEKFTKYGGNPMLVHCRIATAGKVGVDNCHPFKISGGALIHNGHLYDVEDGRGADKSDTRDFAEWAYDKFDYDTVTKAVAKHKLDTTFFGNKVACLYDDGRFLTIGTWTSDEGVLYSNSGYRSRYGYDIDDNW